MTGVQTCALPIWRLVRFASEDIGVADPQALRVALDAKQAYEFIGLPEGKLALAQCVIYLSAAPKSNSVYTAYAAVADEVEHTRSEPVPLHIRSAPTRGRGLPDRQIEEARQVFCRLLGSRAAG